MPRLPKRILPIIISSFLILISGFSLHSQVQANPQDVFYKNVPELDAEKIGVRETAATDEDQSPLINSLDVTYSQTNHQIYALVNMIAPTCSDPEKCGCKPQDTAIGNIGLAMQSIYAHPPASLAWYVADTIHRAGFIKPVHAQGIGFAGMSPLLPLWRASRDVAYIALILVMLVIGFMVIFRMKIDPKTVISIQAALPKVVVAMILISFSYAIVGLMIDLMYLSMLLIIDILARGMGGDFITEGRIAHLQQAFTTGGQSVLAGNIFLTGIGQTLDQFYQGLMLGVTGTAAGVGVGLGGFGIVSGIGTIIGTAPGWLVGGILGAAIVSALFLLILFLALLFVFLRFLMILFNSYIQIIISLILGPIVLLQEAIPGKSAFGNWIKGLVSNLIVFPLTATILMFAEFIATADTIEHIWQPPLLAIGVGKTFQAFLTLSILFMGPTLVTTVKKSFKATPALPISAGSAFTPVTTGTQSVMGAASQFYYAQGIISMLKNRGSGSAGPQHH